MTDYNEKPLLIIHTRSLFTVRKPDLESDYSLETLNVPVSKNKGAHLNAYYYSPEILDLLVNLYQAHILSADPSVSNMYAIGTTNMLREFGFNVHEDVGYAPNKIMQIFETLTGEAFYPRLALVLPQVNMDYEKFITDYRNLAAVIGIITGHNVGLNVQDATFLSLFAKGVVDRIPKEYEKIPGGKEYDVQHHEYSWF